MEGFRIFYLTIRSQSSFHPSAIAIRKRIRRRKITPSTFINSSVKSVDITRFDEANPSFTHTHTHYMKIYIKNDVDDVSVQWIDR